MQCFLIKFFMARHRSFHIRKKNKKNSGNNVTNVVVCFKYQDAELPKQFLPENFSLSQ